jgi:hypothetical protein
MSTPLRKIAYARSGDKGSSANIGLIAYSAESYSFLEEYLTAERVKEYFAALQPLSVVRYELPNLNAFNFVLKGILGGGASRSLRLDSQGKALAQALLEMEVEL